MADFLQQWRVDIEKDGTDKKKLLETMVMKFTEEPKNVAYCCCLVEACLVYADNCALKKNKADSKKYTEESLKYAKKAVELDVNSMEAHKWYCASVGRMAPLVGTKERIQFGHEFKEHRDIAVEIDDNDKLMHHMYGRWCFEVASLSYLERKIAETFFGTPPKASFEEALQSLLKADSLHHEWKTNHLWVAKVYIALRKYAEAIEWIDSGLSIKVETEDDGLSELELKELEKSYAKYRQKK